MSLSGERMGHPIGEETGEITKNSGEALG